MIKQNNDDTPNKSETITIGENVASGNKNINNHLIPLNGSQMNLQALQRSTADRVLSELDNGVATVEVETRVYDAILAAMNSLVITRGN